MTIKLKIEDSYIEAQLRQFVKDQKEITLDSLKSFLDSFQPKEKLHFKKRDPRQYSRIVKRKYNPNDVDDFALQHIKDSEKYEHNLRREKR